MLWTTLIPWMGWGEAHAQDLQLDEVFPPQPLTSAQVGELLSPEVLGPPSQVYDQTTRTQSPDTALEREVELQAFGSAIEDLAAPDSLRRYGELSLTLLRTGTPNEAHELLLAEHVGVATVPDVLGTFATSAEDPAQIAGLVQQLSKDLLKQDNLQQLAVALQRDEELGLTTGLITGIYGAAEFEPFSKTYEPGAFATIPGTLLDGDSQYALYVTYPGIEVRSFPLEGEGAFDIEVPLPDQPGVYRVSMSRYQNKKRLPPESPFFFSLYVGQEPGEQLALPDLGAPVDDLDSLEVGFVEILNAHRAEHDLQPVERVGDSAAMREVLAEMPERRRAQYRWMRRSFQKDPLPEQPHGVWYPAYSSGQGVEDIAWLALEHPVIRASLLDPGISMIRLGAIERWGRFILMEAVIEPPEDMDAMRDRSFEELAERWPGTLPPKKAPELEARLDAICAQVASGELKLQKALKQVDKIYKKEPILAGSASYQVLYVPPGQEPDLSGVNIPKSAKYLAIGQASGDLGDSKGGIEYSVLLLVMSDIAR